MPSPRRVPPRPAIGSRTQRRVLRVLTEGVVTEPGYLALIARRYRGVTIDYDRDNSGADPYTLVTRARSLQARSRRRSKREGPDFDEIWCVFDIDQHPNVASALQEARDAGINVAVSNPCFELWLVLHDREHTAWIHRHDIQRTARDIRTIDGKGVIDGGWVASWPVAAERADRLTAMHEGNGSQPGENPSTGVGQLLRQIDAAT